MLEANDIRIQLCSSDLDSDDEDDLVFSDDDKDGDGYPE
jgi:hypothetical protein